MIDFILLSRRGRTDGRFRSLRAAGRLDVVYQCILFAFFTSGTIRRDVIFHAILGGPPNPPLHLRIDGRELRNVRTDERTWERILKKVLSGGSHPGIKIERRSFQDLVRSFSNRKIFVLEEKGQDVINVDFGSNPVFILGDQIGLPKKDEMFALRFGTKISLGKRPYLAATCIDIINYLLDLRVKREEPKDIK
ncbi:tRNA (pseudouridine(54)-N(1))-methyltransferase TrmY [Candidatus Bathyarchaeota archaeon]|nr:MAG: tRNA (pseudouridine(54)-N(1))-methyltransferase TrmY [Candidatus Bathyarchaeota archaeon]